MAVLTAGADTYTWSPNSDGQYTDPTHWKVGEETATDYPRNAGDSAYFDYPYGAGFTVGLPTLDHKLGSVLISTGWSDSVDGHETILDGEGQVFRQADRTGAEAEYGEYPFGFMAGSISSWLYVFHTYRYWAKNVAGQGRCGSVSLSNILMKASSQYQKLYLVKLERGCFNNFDPNGTELKKDMMMLCSPVGEGRLEVGENAHLRLANLRSDNAGRAATLRFNGGTHEILGNEGGLQFPGAGRGNVTATETIDLLNGTKLTARDVTLAYSGNNAHAGITTRLTVVDGSALTVTNAFNAANSNNGGTFEMVVSNATVTSRATTLGKATSGTSCSVTLKDDATFNAGTVLIGNGTYTLEGGSAMTCGYTRLGDGNAEYAPTVKLNAGATLTCSSEFHIGAQGGGLLWVDGGCLNATMINMGVEPRSSQNPIEAVFKITGGKVHLEHPTAHWYYTFNAVCGKAWNGTARVILDGGVVETWALHGWANAGGADQQGIGTAVLEANGGTLRPTKATTSLLSHFNQAKLGAKGLTIDSVYATTTAQNFTDMDGQEGRLVMAGSEDKTLSGTASTESVLALAAGRTIFTATASHYSHLVVTNGATFSTVGACTGPTFKGLTLGDAVSAGCLEGELADVIRVDAPVTAVRAKIVIPAGEAVTPGTYPRIVCKGAISAESADRWAKHTSVAGGDAAYFYSTVSSYDESADETTLSLVVSTEVPDDQKIVVSEGTRTVTEPTEFTKTMYAEVASGASLAFAAPVTGGGLVKQGGGVMTLSEGNVFPNGLSVGGGSVIAAIAEALGWTTGANDGLKLVSGTLEIGQADTETVYGGPVEIAANANKDAVIVKAHGTVTMPAPTGTRGAFIKRGEGRLVFESGASRTILAQSAGCYTGNDQLPSQDPIVWDPEGASPTANYPALAVQEGELVLRGTAPGVAFNAKGYAYVGMPSSACAAEPTLTIDHAAVDMMDNVKGGSRFFMMPCVGQNKALTTKTYLNVTNGASLKVEALQPGRSSWANGVQQEILLDNGTITCTWMTWGNYGTGWNGYAKWTLRNGSRLNAGDSISFYNGGEFFVDNSVVAKNDASDLTGTVGPYTLFSQPPQEYMGADAKYMQPRGMYFTNGSKFYCSKVQSDLTATPTTFAFDDSEWIPSKSGDFTFNFGNRDWLVFDMRGAGVILRPGAGATWTVKNAFTGEGGLKKDGAGTLAFSAENGLSWNFAGPLKVLAGTVTVESGAVRENAVADISSGAALDLGGATLAGLKIGGAGTVRNGAVNGLRVAVRAEGGVPTVDASCTYAGVVTLDYGKEKGDTSVFGVRLPVLKVSGTADLSAFKAVNAGRGSVVLDLEQVGDTVYATPSIGGSVIILK